MSLFKISRAPHQFMEASNLSINIHFLIGEVSTPAPTHINDTGIAFWIVHGKLLAAQQAKISPTLVCGIQEKCVSPDDSWDGAGDPPWVQLPSTSAGSSLPPPWPWGQSCFSASRGVILEDTWTETNNASFSPTRDTTLQHTSRCHAGHSQESRGNLI